MEFSITIYNEQIEIERNGVPIGILSIRIRDDKDVQALAIEIASLMKRKQTGRGVRLA